MCLGEERRKITDELDMAKLFPAILTLLVAPILVAILVDIFVTNVIDPEAFSLQSPQKFEGVLEPNERLSSAYKLFEGQILGPESVVVDGDHIYTGTADGKVLHIYHGEIQILATLGKPPCGGFNDEPNCGRPLGMRLNKEGYLVVVDGYLGLFQINVATGDVTTLYSSKTKINGKEPKLLNDLDIASDGTIYFSDSSTKWDRRQANLLVLESRPDGRILKYSPNTGKVEVAVDGLYFPNGVQLSKDESSLLFPETSRCRIQRYYLSGEKAGQMEIFADNLPGLPDNIRRSKSGGYWVGMAIVRHPNRPNLYDWVAGIPFIRRILPKIFDQEVLIKLGGKPYGLLVELNEDGAITRSLHDPTGEVVPSASEVEDDYGTLYVGSYHSSYIAKVELPKRL